jgi:hypothetical protein
MDARLGVAIVGCWSDLPASDTRGSRSVGVLGKLSW